MTVRELIDALQYFDENKEVRLAQQPNYPFEYSIDNVVEFSKEGEHDRTPSVTKVPFTDGGHTIPGEDSVRQDADDEHIVYITEGQQLGYLSKEVWEISGAYGW